MPLTAPARLSSPAQRSAIDHATRVLDLFDEYNRTQAACGGQTGVELARSAGRSLKLKGELSAAAVELAYATERLRQRDASCGGSLRAARRHATGVLDAFNEYGKVNAQARELSGPALAAAAGRANTLKGQMCASGVELAYTIRRAYGG